MKTSHKILLYILNLIVLLVLFGGCLYRTLVSYKSIGDRKNYLATNQSLIEFIENNDQERKSNIDDVIRLSLKLTSKKLNFAAAKNNNDSNLLIDSKNAHCVGYAAFFSTTCNYLIKKHNLEDWQANPKIGNIYFLGENIHKHLNDPFFNDHDFVIIENKETKEKTGVDPTLNDYLCIQRVCLE